jgi:hypothetical protein
MARHRRVEPGASNGRHRPARSRDRIPVELRHSGGGHRASLGCTGWLMVAVSVAVLLFVDTHRPKA